MTYPANYSVLREQLKEENFAHELIEELIVAHQAHEALVKTLQGVLRVADRKTDEFDAARAALAKAGAA